MNSSYKQNQNLVPRAFPCNPPQSIYKGKVRLGTKFAKPAKVTWENEVNTDRFGKLSVRKALNPLRVLKGIFTSNFHDMGNLRPCVFGLIKMSFRVPKKGQ